MAVKMMMALSVLMFVELALGGYPQCSTIEKCMYTHVSSEFGDVWNRGTGRYYKPSLYNFYLDNPQYLNATCSRQNWIKAHQCVADCPLQLEITDPPEYRMTVCAIDNAFQPFAPNGHIDLYHPLNGKVLDIVAASPVTSDHTGCSNSDYTDKNYTNKIIMIKRGGCYFYDKFQSAAAAGGGVSVMVNNQWSNLRANQFVSMGGRASGFEQMPAVSISAQTGDAIIEGLEAGVVMKGKLQLICDKPPVDPNIEFDLCKQPFYDDFCDYTGVAEEDRMCSKCSIQINYDGNKTACVWHNDLHPLARRNLINMNSAVFSGGLPFPTDEMVFITGWPTGGCSRAEWQNGDLVGKIVFQPEPTTCTLFQTLRHAQAAGVKAFIHVNNAAGYTNLMQGDSELITIPVHSLHAQDVTSFLEWVTENGVSFNSTRRINTATSSFERSEILGYRVPTVTLTDPKLPEQTPLETPAPENSTISNIAAVSGSSSFEWNFGVVICSCLIGMLLLSIIIKFIHQRTNSVELPDDPTEEVDTGLSVPLSVASMGLSLTLLFIISGTAFTLAYTAGQDSTETARNDGRTAVDTTYKNAVENVESLSVKWQNAIVESAEAGAKEWFRDGELVARQVSDLFVLYDGTWASFQPVQQSLLSVGRQSFWKIHVKIEAEGFFMAENYITDDGTYSGDRPITETNNGYLYGTNFQSYSDSTKTLRYHSTHVRSEWPMESSVGEVDQNPFDLSRDLPDKSFAWLMSSYSYPRLDTQYHPISVLTPIVVRGLYVGCVESMRSINDLSQDLQSIVSSYPGTQNITSMMFDRKTGILVSSSEGTSRPVDQYLSVSYTDARESYSLNNTFSIEMNAYGGYVQELYNGSLFSTESNSDGTLTTGRFNQRDFYQVGSGWLQTHFSFETHEKNIQGSSMIHDASVAGYRGEVRDGVCSTSLACIVDAPMPGRPNNKALYLDRNSTFYLYINLTTDAPRVQRTRVSNPNDPWVSNFRLYNDTHTFSDGSEVIVYQDPAPNGYLATVLREPLLYNSVTFSMWVNPSTAVNDSNLINSDSPRLFSDTYLGDAAVRWYANGIFYLGISTFGCTTDPIIGGPPVNEWTHLIATVNRANFTCRVYVNGTLHSDHAISRTAAYGKFEEPYRVGEYYHGMLDEIRIFNRSFTNQEAVDHYNTGGFNREVDSRIWNYIEKPISYRDMNYVFVILIPEEDILREVNANNEATRLNLQIQEKNTQTKLDQKAAETVFILVTIALFSVLVFLVFNELLTRPFSLFAFQLTEAAVMRVDEIPSSRSFIKEMNALHKAMALMVGNLKEYKSYMPQTLLAINESSSDSDKTDFTGIAGVASGSTVGGRGTRIGGSSAPRSTRGSSRGSTATTTNHSGSWKASMSGTHDIVAANCRSAQGKKAGMVLHLSKKKVSFCAMNIINFHAMFEKHSEQGIIEAHGQCMNMALHVYQMYKGIPDTFCGDRMLCSFNAVKPVATHRVSACRAVLAMEEKLKELEISYPGIAISQSAASGDAKVGNMGTDGMKRFSFITPVVSWCFALERFAKHTGFSNLVDFHISEEAKAEFIVQHIASISYSKRHSTKGIRVTRLLKPRDARDVEWMYQLAEGELTDPYAAWNHTAKAIFSDEWKEAENFVQGIPSVVANGKLYDSFLQAIQEKRYNVPKIEFH